MTKSEAMSIHTSAARVLRALNRVDPNAPPDAATLDEQIKTAVDETQRILDMANAELGGKK